MQNKGLIKLFAILFGLVSLYQLSFTWFTNGVEDKAKMYAESKSDNGKEMADLERLYLDSIANKPVIDLGFVQFSYGDIKDKELNLGLDLKGGINAILQVSVKDILKLKPIQESTTKIINKIYAKNDIEKKIINNPESKKINEMKKKYDLLVVNNAKDILILNRIIFK